MHEEDADGATQALRYIAEDQDYDGKRSSVWRNLLVEGAGGIRVYVEPSRATGYGQGEMEIKIDYVSWDRCFWDPHSSRPDFSDAAYLGIVVWMDYSDALARYPDGKEALDTTMASATHTETYDDKPKFSSWADKKRKRVRICQMWIARRSMALRRVHQGWNPRGRPITLRDRHRRERLRVVLPIGIHQSRE